MGVCTWVGTMEIGRGGDSTQSGGSQGPKRPMFPESPHCEWSPQTLGYDVHRSQSFP